MVEEPVTVEQALQVPWYRRDKAQREVIYQHREAARKAKLKRADDTAAQKSQHRRDERDRFNQAVARSRAQDQRRWYQRAPVKWIVFWGGLSGDDGVYIPGTAPGDRTATPKQPPREP